MSDETQERRRYGLWVALALVLVPILYTLSMGPAHYLIRRTEKGVNPFVCAYRPVIWLHDNTPLEKPLEGYMKWWSRLAD
jgi:hypothetical protein